MSNEEEVVEEAVPGWVIAVICTTLSAVAATCGNMSMKKAQMVENANIRLGKKSSRIGSVPVRNCWWWIGFVTLVLIPAPLEVVALSSAGQSLVYPLGGGLTIIFSQLSAPYTVGEKLTRIDIIASVIVIAGICITVTFGTKVNGKYDVSTLVALLGETTFLIVLLSFQFVNLCVMVLWYFHRTFLVNRYSGLVLVSLAYCSAVWAATQGIVLKSVGELFSITFSLEEGEASPFASYIAWLFLLCVPIIGVLQITYMNYGLLNFQAIKFIPIYNTLVVVIPSIIGAVYFQELDQIQPIGYTCGLFVVCAGILLLMKRTVAEHVPTGREVSIRIKSAKRNTIGKSRPVSKVKSENSSPIAAENEDEKELYIEKKNPNPSSSGAERIISFPNSTHDQNQVNKENPVGTVVGVAVSSAPTSKRGSLYESSSSDQEEIDDDDNNLEVFHPFSIIDQLRLKALPVTVKVAHHHHQHHQHQHHHHRDVSVPNVNEADLARKATSVIVQKTSEQQGESRLAALTL